jgi:ribosomal protein RSM22 (predicted rRNA methylase)
MPPPLFDKIEPLIKGKSLRSLAKERKGLSRGYREGRKEGIATLGTDDKRLAYLSARLPATYTAVCQVLRECQHRVKGEEITSLLDVGAGPGTGLLAAASLFPIQSATLLERDRGFIELGTELTKDLDGIEKTWVCQDITAPLTPSPHDLVLVSYALNELNEKDRQPLIEKLWELAQKFLIIVEPGSKAAFESLKNVRQSLLSKGAHLLAPCPHQENCPLPGSDWCHFSVRVQRSSLHRKTKDATLNYEDEKFSYLIFAKNEFEACHSRVIRRPFKGEGFIKLQLCSSSGIETKTVTKKNKSDYSVAKKIEWGNNYKPLN